MEHTEESRPAVGVAMASASEPSAHPRTATGAAPLYERGSRVLVEEPGIPPWAGTVGAMKRGSRCWYVEVRRDDDGLTYVVPEPYVTSLSVPGAHGGEFSDSDATAVLRQLRLPRPETRRMRASPGTPYRATAEDGGPRTDADDYAETEITGL